MAEFDVVAAATIGSQGAGNTGRHWRTKILASSVLENATRIKVLFDYAGAWSISSAWVGHKGAGAYDFDGNQVQLKFSGSDGASFAGELYSDEISFTVDSSKDLIVSLAVTSAGIPYATITGRQSAYNTGGDAAAAASSAGSVLAQAYTVGISGVVGVSDSGIVAYWTEPYSLELAGFILSFTEPWQTISDYLTTGYTEPMAYALIYNWREPYRSTPQRLAYWLEPYPATPEYIRSFSEPYISAAEILAAWREEWQSQPAILAAWTEPYPIADAALLVSITETYSLEELSQLMPFWREQYAMTIGTSLYQRVSRVH